MSTRAKITEKYAAGLAWRGERYIVWDTDQDGFGVQVWGDGSRRAYIAQIKRDGKSMRKTLGRVGEMKCDAARTAAAQYRGAVKEGRDPRAEDRARRGAWTLQDAFDYFNGTHAGSEVVSGLLAGQREAIRAPRANVLEVDEADRDHACDGGGAALSYYWRHAQQR